MPNFGYAGDMLLFVMLWRVVFAQRAALLAENTLLRHQIAVLQRSVRRPKLRAADRLLWVLAVRLWSRWRDALVIVRPDTVVRWHRAGFRLFWRWKCGGGRPATHPDVRSLIVRMARENPLWGVPRIQAELALLGHRVARATIAKYAGRSGTNPKRSVSWRVFIQNHLDSTAAMDFFTLPTLTGRVLYVFLVLSHARRRIVHFNVTAKPCAKWVARQIRDAFPFDTAPKFLLHDNDGLFGEAVSRMLRLLGIREVRTSPGSPWQNAYVERVVGTFRRECFDHVIVLNEAHASRLLGEFVEYHNNDRPHQGLGRDSPEGREPEPNGNAPVVSVPMVGGLHHRYRRAA